MSKTQSLPAGPASASEKGNSVPETSTVTQERNLFQLCNQGRLPGEPGGDWLQCWGGKSVRNIVNNRLGYGTVKVGCSNSYTLNEKRGCSRTVRKDWKVELMPFICIICDTNRHINLLTHLSSIYCVVAMSQALRIQWWIYQPSASGTFCLVGAAQMWSSD